MKLFLGIASVMAFLFGAALLLNPAGFYAPTGMQLTPMLATLAQAHGATLTGMGVVLWLSRGADAAGLRAVLWGNLVVQVLSLAVVLHTMNLGAGMNVLPGVVIHVTLGCFYGFFIKQLGKKA